MLSNPESRETYSDDMVVVIPGGQGTYFEIADVATAMMGPLYGRPDTAILADLAVDERERGKGLASLLVGAVVEEARLQGFINLQAVAANERTVGCFGIFKPQQLRFGLRDPSTGRYAEHAGMSVQGAAEHLAVLRTTLYPDYPSCELPKSQAIIIQADLRL